MRAVGVVRSVKNEATQRAVPIHPTLCALWFANFIEQRRHTDGQNAMLFPSSLPKPGGKTPILGRAYEQAFLRYARDELGLGVGSVITRSGINWKTAFVMRSAPVISGRRAWLMPTRAANAFMTKMSGMFSQRVASRLMVEGMVQS